MPEIIYPDLSYNVQGAFYDVYNTLRYQELSENGWETALMITLADRGLPAQRQAEYELRYKGYRIGRLFPDVVVDEKLLLELKVADRLLPIHVAQVLTYLKATGLKLGILVNFGKNAIEIQRIPNFLDQKAAGGARTVASEPAGPLLYEELTAALRAALYEVHGELGPGLKPMHYRRATRIELRLREIPFESQREIIVRFRGQPIETRTVSLLIVDDKVLLATMAVLELTPPVKARFHQYLQLLDLKLGLIANFHSASLEIATVRL